MLTRSVREGWYTRGAVVILLSLLPHVSAGLWWPFTSPSEVCYGTLGCFSTEEPFTNTQSTNPRSPEEIGTKFFLFTRNMTNRRQELVMTDKEKKCSWRTFCRNLKTKLIIHGYMDHVDKQWVQNMITALLEYDNYNVVVVDWRVGAKEVNYYQSAANIRVVGAQVAQLLKVLQTVYGVKPAAVHIIGHSLGAHAAGYAGEYIEDIGRITGLDPAGPAFEGLDPQVRLDPTDALFVDVIHTDSEDIASLGFGIDMPSGTVDFYPNGGRDQPGCPTSYLAQMKLLFMGDFQLVNNFACSHLRALDIFTESINSNCTFTSFPCAYKNAQSNDSCTDCGAGCGVMGFHTDINTKAGQYTLLTNANEPFCIS